MADVPIKEQIDLVRLQIATVEQCYGEQLDSVWRAILKSLESMQWRPIDTAPKDGTKVLAFHRVGMITIAHYGRNGDFNPLGWISQGGINHIDQPIYWKPLGSLPGERDG